MGLNTYRFCLWKAYLEKGVGLTYYFKTVLLLFGILTLNAKWTIVIAIMYVMNSFLVGWLWYKFKLTDAEHEVQNNVNPFVKEMRSKLKNKTFK